MINNPVYDGVKIKKATLQLVKSSTDNGFFSLSVEEKKLALCDLCKDLCSIYGITNVPNVRMGCMDCYYPLENVIYIKKCSLISFLHEFRHSMQHILRMGFKGMTPEQDARAWSIGIYSKIYPNMFVRMVKANRVLHVKWDEAQSKVVDNAMYI